MEQINYYGQSILTGGGSEEKIDKIIHDMYFNNIYDGFFIEVGANDGNFLSTCKFFEEYKNWQGINIEASVELFNKLIINRPNSINIHSILSDKDGVQEFGYIDFDNGGFSHISDGTINDKQIMNDFKLSFKNKYIVNSTRLDTLIKKLNITNSIDLMVIDTEGNEPYIIKGFGNIKPKILCIEHTHCGLDCLINLLKNEYILDWKDNLNSLFRIIL